MKKVSQISCKVCKKVIIKYDSESYVSGICCYMCRDRIIPDYIPLKQHKQYMEIYYDRTM